MKHDIATAFSLGFTALVAIRCILLLAKRPRGTVEWVLSLAALSFFFYVLLFSLGRHA